MYKAQPGSPIFLPEHSTLSRVFSRSKLEAETVAALVSLGYTPECARQCVTKAEGKPRLASEYAYHTLHVQSGAGACARCPECNRLKMAKFNNYMKYQEEITWGQNRYYDPIFNMYRVEPKRQAQYHAPPRPQPQPQPQVVHVHHHHYHAPGEPMPMPPSLPPPAYSPPKIVPRGPTRGLLG